MFEQEQNFRKKLILWLCKLSRILMIFILIRCVCLLISEGLGNASLAASFSGIRESIQNFFLPQGGATGPKSWLMGLLYLFWGLPFYPALRTFLGIPGILVWIALQLLIRHLRGTLRVRNVVTNLRDNFEKLEEPKHGKDTLLEKIRHNQILVRVISTPVAPVTIDEICDLRDTVEWNISAALQKEGLQVQFNNCDFRLCLQGEEPVIYLGNERIQALTEKEPVMLRGTEDKQPLVYVMRLEV
ncbi:MAG: hypothetical protein ACOX7K_04300 [Oscillospiraceae bacterium]|jgi:hypothetical protein